MCFILLVISWFDGNHEQIHAALENTTTNNFQSSLCRHFLLHRTAIILCVIGIVVYVLLILRNLFLTNRNADDINSPTSCISKYFDAVLRYGKALVAALAPVIQIVCTVAIAYLAVDELQQKPQKEIEILLRDVIVTVPAAMRALEATNGCCGVRLKTGKINYPDECLSPVLVPTCTDKVSDSLIGSGRCIILLLLTTTATVVMFIVFVQNRKRSCAEGGHEPEVAPVVEPEEVPLHEIN
uniref:Tetraspanin n=1 Tax=Plectus sambesii TaxID=2011161 RepID=A0A914W7T6_9BILA